MKTSKFDLLFENIMDVLQKAEVSYELTKTVVLKHIANFLELPLDELIDEFGNNCINVKVADYDDIISFVNDGFSNEVTRAEAEEKAGKLLIVDLEGLPMDEDTYNELIENR
jgi:hypothetical protein